VDAKPALRPSPGSSPERGALDAADLTRGRLMAQSLGRLLDRAAGAREVLPHLAALERSLIEHGASAIRRVPPHWLSRICSQLASLPLPEEDLPLQDLARRLMSDWQAQQPERDDESLLEAEKTLVIREISHSAFEAALAEQGTTVPMPPN
jgi:hypothetical protein